MRFKMIGYGQFHYRTKSGARVAWPVIGVALQKNYISVYFAIAVDDKPVVDPYVGKLGELRSGINNFSFQSFDELEPKALAALFADAASIFEIDPYKIPSEPCRVREGPKWRPLVDKFKPLALMS